MKSSSQIFFIIVFITLFTSIGFSQTKTASTSPQVREQHSKANVNQQVQPTGPVFQLDENDPYQGRKEEFLNQLIVKELPTDFPKYQKGWGVKYYNQMVDQYYEKHPEILTEKVKRKLTPQ